MPSSVPGGGGGSSILSRSPLTSMASGRPMFSGLLGGGGSGGK
jgi:hypothetical protein